MQTASDDVFERAERLAQRLGKSRSELVRDAVALYLARHEDKPVTDEEVDPKAAGPRIDPAVDAFVREAARLLIERR